MDRQSIGFQILGSLVGIVAGVMTIGFVESIGHMLFPTATLEDISEFPQIISAIPMPAKLWVVMSWGLGVFLGGLVALFIARGTHWPGLIVALFLFSGAVWTMFQFPHPPWMIVGAVLMTLLGTFGAQKVMSGR